jgi:hypothetical protein
LSRALGRFELKPSLPLAFAIIAAHAAAGAAAFAALRGPGGAALALALLALGAAAAWHRALLRSRQSVRAVEIVEEGGVVLELAGGARIAATVAPRRYVSRLMVTLPVTRPRRQTILVTRGMLDEAAFRHLRLWALWDRLPALAAPA